MSYTHYTQAQIEQAKSTDLVAFLQSRGETLKRSGSEYVWRDGSEKVTIRGNKWFHHYSNTGGTAIDFVRRFFNMDFPQAMEQLIGNTVLTPPQVSKTISKERKEFSLPERNNDMRRVYAYLLNTRFIDREIIHHFTHNNMLYEDSEHHNAVFVGFDENGTPCHAHKRGTAPGSTFKGNVDSCKAEYSFHHTGTSNTLYVFEAPIDMLSYITLHPKDWERHSYVALCCTAGQAALKMLELNHNIDAVHLCLDSDDAGENGSFRIAKSIREAGNYTVIREAPPQKDWNEVLKVMHGIQPLPAEPIQDTEDIRLLVTDLCERLDRIEPCPARPLLAIENAIKKLENPNTNLQEQATKTSQLALSFCLMRFRQLSEPVSHELIAEKLMQQYSPYRNGNVADCIVAMEQRLKSISDDYMDNKVYTKTQLMAQTDKALGIVLDSLCLIATINMEQDESEMTMSM